MLSINQLFKHFFKKTHHNSQVNTETEEDLDFSESIVLLQIGLTKEYDIDISIDMKDIDIKNNADIIFKAQKIAKFFNLLTNGSLNYNISKIMVDQIGSENDQYKSFIESIMYNWILLEKEDTEQDDINKQPVISPIDVFGTYINNEK